MEEKMEVIQGTEEVIKLVLDNLTPTQEKLDICVDAAGITLITSNEYILNEYCKAKDRGVKIRIITDITSSSISYSKKIIPIAEVRHMNGLIGSFGISEKDYISTDISPFGTASQRAIHCNIKAFVQQQQYFFNIIWKKAIPVEQKIQEIERGIKVEKIETITDPSEIESTYVQLLHNATNEILLIFPTSNSMQRQPNIRIFQLLKEKINHHNGIQIRIISPSPISPLFSNKSLKEKTNQELELGNSNIYKNNIFIRDIDVTLSTKSTILVVDRKESLVMEVKDDLKEKFSDSVGFGTYSNSSATVLSYVSIFESLWIQTDLYRQLKDANEQLKIHDTMQKDFIHIAAHELKNPIQPILGLSNLLMKHKPTTDEKEFHNIAKTINRNAKKLIQLTNDILDITKIETNNLNLNKELFNLGDLISDIIEDYKDQLDNENVKLASKFIYSSKPDEKKENREENKCNISVFADRTRINQVISNLLNNAIKFTNKGFINIMIEKKYTENKVNISVKDTGCGIDQIILPKLFSKFATKSKGGTGLRLYISKNIIEAHGGQIYANNNRDGKGATFGFSLPIIE
ncbi:MAG TPA: HAMP domain-containing sensor histidine kinase [Candidatus Sulfopaludibacter sp.]|nr:HAMP domain-containing sensor histidine kinase [Candidatus Sulfopaludibacter sp.]